MQSDDFFFRKFKRNNPRPLLSAVNFEPKTPRPAPEPPGTTVRARISEWPPRREEGAGGKEKGAWPEFQAAEVQGGNDKPEEEEEEEEEEEAPPTTPKVAPKMAAQGRNPSIQRSNSEVTITESAGEACDQRTALHPVTGASLHREYGSASSIERGRLGSEVTSAPRFHDPYLLLGLPASPDDTQERPAPEEASRKLRSQRSDPDGPRSPPPQTQTPSGPDEPSRPRLSAKSLVHYDVQSILFELRRAACDRGSAGRRKNMATGASAASQLPDRPASPGGSGSQELCQTLAPPPSPGGVEGRGRCQLVLSCPHFCCETGGEGVERQASRCPNAALSVLEEPRESHLARQGSASYFVEHADLGANYYRKYFSGKEHQNFFGSDESLGPVAVSLRREDKDKDAGSSSQYNYRIIVRTTELRTLRASILEEAFPSSVRHGTQRGIPPKKLLEYVVPGLNIHCLRLASNSPKVPEMLLKLDEQGLTFQRKVGVMYCKAGQSSEEEMYNNETASPAFDEFLDLLGQRVRLRGFEKYRAQLDNKTDSTGTHSLHTTYQEYEIMFHVSTMLPYTANNRQQLLRKRHIGNDIVTIVFQEPGADPFTPKTIRSHFQHVFLVVQVHDPCTQQVSYSVAVTRSKDVPEFGPSFQKGVTFPKLANFREFLLAKLINAENAAEKSEKFHTMATRTRQEYLRDLADNFVTTAPLDSSSSKLAAIISLPTKKKEKLKGSRAPELHSPGALVWNVTARRAFSPQEAECVLGISNEFVVLLDQKLRVVVLNCSCRDVIGWTLSPGSVIIYYERGEFLAVKTLESQPDDITEIVHRLEIVTTGCETDDLVLRRNSVHHLAFQTNGEGIVTQVEKNSYAEMMGLRLFSRLVRICEIPVVSMSYKERAECLRKVDQVKITVIPPDEKGKPRMSFSELYRKSIEETERKNDIVPRATEMVLGQPCLPLLRVSSLQETRSADPQGNQCLPIRSCSLEKTAPQSQRNQGDPCFSVLKSSPPDLILAGNTQHLLPSESPDLDPGDTQVFNLHCPLSWTSSTETHSRFPGGADHSLSDPPPSDSTSTDRNPPTETRSQLHDIAASDASDTEWQSLADIASYCESLAQAFSLEDGTAEDARPVETTESKGETRPRESPTGLNEKVVHLEAIVKQLQQKLIKEQEDKGRAGD
ncbi:signal-induced proliferation-associated 1-like protein 2 isoform X2 [Heptranchias perlo]|uniref:signal-induced proliferation-associated 1-like protein 2 isoform X2 n=1 Tax=Heptranchias perlo TaxID=212740 RepID=UPI003559AF89